MELLHRYKLSMASQSHEPMVEDTHEATITDPELRTVDDVCRAFFTSSPAWLSAIMRVRNGLLSRIGFLSGGVEKREAPDLPEVIEVGQTFSVFEILDRSTTEILMGGDDTHFSLRISLFITPGGETLQIGTAAYPRNKIGQAYLTVVNLFHGPIARMLAKRIAQGVR